MGLKSPEGIRDLKSKYEKIRGLIREGYRDRLDEIDEEEREEIERIRGENERRRERLKREYGGKGRRIRKIFHEAIAASLPSLLEANNKLLERRSRFLDLETESLEDVDAAIELIEEASGERRGGMEELLGALKSVFPENVETFELVRGAEKEKGVVSYVVEKAGRNGCYLITPVRVGDEESFLARTLEEKISEVLERGKLVVEFDGRRHGINYSSQRKDIETSRGDYVAYEITNRNSSALVGAVGETLQDQNICPKKFKEANLEIVIEEIPGEALDRLRPHKNYLSREEVAKKLGVGTETIEWMGKRGKIRVEEEGVEEDSFYGWESSTEYPRGEAHRQELIRRVKEAAQDSVYSIREVAELLGKRPATIYSWKSKEEINAETEEGRVGIPREDLLSYLKERYFTGKRWIKKRD